MPRLLLPLLCLLVTAPALCATYFVDASAGNASDENPGTEAAPWKTLRFAGSAAVLKPGDSVLIKTGVYREAMAITVSGEEGQPITFAAAPDAVVVVKGSESVKGAWTKLLDDPSAVEPFPNAFADVWKIKLGRELFTDSDCPEIYADSANWWVSGVFLDDNRALQQIGPDHVYNRDPWALPANPGRGVADLVDNSSYYDGLDQTLYVKISGEPSWFNIEIGVRMWALRVAKVHDVVVRGIEFRHNRNPGGQWPMGTVGECERVTIEGCAFYQADFAGLSLGRSKNCVVRDCEMWQSGCNGFTMGECEDCVVEDCRLIFNNRRRFRAGWAAGGMKCIPANKRCTIQRCEAAYNIDSPGIWFDYDNEDIRILDNVSHHNGSDGIFFEINGRRTPESRGGLIAGNLCYANTGRGIYVSGSRRLWVVHNTVVGNGAGIVCMPREDPYKIEEVEVRNNILARNYVTQAPSPAATT
jgi:hypothetical protein